MRTFVAATVAATVIASSAFAATGASTTLAPGKPAGVQHAQGADNTVWYLVGFGFVGAGFGLLASGDSDGSIVPGTVPAAPTSTP